MEPSVSPAHIQICTGRVQISRSAASRGPSWAVPSLWGPGKGKSRAGRQRTSRKAEEPSKPRLCVPFLPLPRIKPIWLPSHVGTASVSDTTEHTECPENYQRHHTVSPTPTPTPAPGTRNCHIGAPFSGTPGSWLPGQLSPSHITSLVSPGGREQRGFLCPGLREAGPLAFPTDPPSLAVASPSLPRHITDRV